MDGDKKLKIVGTVNDPTEAKEIEDIVKAYVVELRILHIVNNQKALEKAIVEGV